MDVIEKLLSEIRPYERNPRINDEAVKPVAESIKEFGWRVPVIIDGDGVIIAGHTRYKAAELLGLETVPCVIASDLTPQQVNAFRLADNKTGEIASWDFGALSAELEWLEDMDVEMTAFGFPDIGDETTEDLDSLFAESGSRKEKEPKTAKCPHCGEVFEI